MFLKGDNFRDFLFASLDEKALRNMGVALKGKYFLRVKKFYPVRIGINKNYVKCAKDKTVNQLTLWK